VEAGIGKLPVHHSVSEMIDRLAAPSPDHFTGTVKSTSTSPNGKTVIEIKTSGKWVAASCPNEDSNSTD
jgi:hypothetical protein